MATNSKYYEQASAIYNPQYNSKVTSLNNQLNTTLQGLDQSKTGVNQNYDTQVQKQNLMNTLAKNNISNQANGRGLATSSIVTSGLAGSDAKNTRQVGYINTDRINALNNIEAQKALAQQNTANTLGQLAGDKESYLQQLAMQFEDKDRDYAYKDKSLAMQQQAQRAEMAYKYAMMKQQAEQTGFSNQLARDKFNFDKEQYNNTLSQKDWKEQLDIQSSLEQILNSDKPYSDKQNAMNVYANALNGTKYSDMANNYANNKVKTYQDFVPSNYDPTNGGSNSGGLFSGFSGLGSFLNTDKSKLLKQILNLD